MMNPDAPKQDQPAPCTRSGTVLCVAVGLVVLVVDLLSKAVVFAYYDPNTWPQWLQRHYNTGVAWSLFANHPGWVTMLTLLLIPVIATVWWREYRLQGAWINVAFGGILGGAVGNAWDRVVAAATGAYPGVRDFIAVDLNVVGINYQWPTFNIADSGICVGFVILLATSLLRTKSP